MRHVRRALFAHRRGTVPATGTADHRAITEEEFRLARELGLRCLVFLSRAGAREPGLSEFLDREVSDYAAGVWARPYDTEGSLRREIAAALAAVRPRMALSLGSGPDGLQARLFLGGLQPAWTGEAVLGPVAVDLALGPGTRGVLDAFRAAPLRETGCATGTFKWRAAISHPGRSPVRSARRWPKGSTSPPARS